MSIWTILMILGAVAAFLYGIWAGLGTWDQSQEEIDRAMTEPGRRRRATRHFTPLDLMARMTGIPTQRDRRNPFRFGEDDEGLADPREGAPRLGDLSPEDRGALSFSESADSEPGRGSEDAASRGEHEPEASEEKRGGRGTPPAGSSASQERVDDDETGADDGSQEISEPDDHP